MGTRSPSTSTVDGTFRAFLTANQPRQDLVDAGLTTEPNHGFTWTPSPALDGNLHAVAVYAINVGAGAAGVPLVGSPSAVNPLPVSLDPPREVLGPQTNGLINFPDAPVGTITWKGVKHRYLGEGHNLNSWQAIEQADGSWVVQTTPTLTQGTTTFDDGVWLYDVVNGGTRVRGWYSAEEYRDHVRVCSIAAGVPQSLQPTSAARTTARCSGMRTRKSREKFHGAMLGYAATRASGSSSRRASRETPAGRTWCSSSSIRLRRKTITNEFQSAPRPTIRAARLGVGFSWNETTWNAASPVTEESRCPGRM